MTPGIDPARLLEAGLSHHQAGRVGEAEGIYRALLALVPAHPDGLHYLGMLRVRRGSPETGLPLLARSVAMAPTVAEFRVNIAATLRDARKPAAAVSVLRRAMALDPQLPETLLALGRAFLDGGGAAAAAVILRRAVRLRPGAAPPLAALGLALEAARQPGAAAEALHRAATAGDVASLHHLGRLFRAAGNFAKAIDFLNAGLRRRPDWPEALELLAHTLSDAGRHREAVDAYTRLWRLRPDHPEALSDVVYEKLHVCLWDGLEDDIAAIRRLIRERGVPVPPFITMAIDATAAEQRTATRAHLARQRLPAPSLPPPRPEPAGDHSHGGHPHGGRLRIGYLSGDYYEQATALLVAQLFELHDRSRFEICGYCYSPVTDSPMHRRIAASFDRFRRVRDADAPSAARAIRDDGVHILVDLKGHTREFRPEILALRPAPVQLHYLVFPGTIGADFIDYTLVDRIAVPFALQAHFTERLVYLPGTYQINDRNRTVGVAPSRAACGLPESGFVFCSFNNTYKIRPALFDLWMRLLAAVPGSVLWLLAPSPGVVDNLRREAAARGIDPTRLVFAPLVPPERHLARYRVADLALDTAPVTGHTTTSDALWAGCPVVTMPGENFAGRVAASLLHAAGLPELVAGSAAGYEALALRLARDPEALAAARRRLGEGLAAGGRAPSRLFDSAATVRAIERAYAIMWDIHRSGSPPVPFSVLDPAG